VEIVSTEGDDQRRAASFQRALAHLAGGGFVVLALDVVQGAGLPVPCLGRTLALARGPFALARLAGAPLVPLVPLVARWRRGGVEAEAGEPIAVDPKLGPADRERALAESAGRWLERYLLSSPSELSLGLLRILLA
jgi:lauroyl/myristoyl acyltransferase